MSSNPNQPPYRQPPYSQPQPGQPPYQQPPSPYPRPAYGQPPAGPPPGHPPYQPPPSYPRPPYGQPSPGQPPTHYPRPPYGPPPYRQPLYGPPPSARLPFPSWRSRHRLWIMLGSAVVLLALLGGGLVLGLNTWNRAERAATATQFYSAIAHQDYVTASGFLQVAGGSAIAAREQQLFVASAQLLDKTRGPVTSFQVAADAQDATLVDVAVTRHGSTYPVHLQIQQVEGAWKIIKADGL